MKCRKAYLGTLKGDPVTENPSTKLEVIFGKEKGKGWIRTALLALNRVAGRGQMSLLDIQGSVATVSVPTEEVSFYQWLLLGVPDVVRVGELAQENAPAVTFGAFFDAVKEIAPVEAMIFMEEWASRDDWTQKRQQQLSLYQVVSFANDMADAYGEKMTAIGNPEHFTKLLTEGHSFLKEIRGKIAEMGIEVDVKYIDVPISLAERLSACDEAKIVRKKELPNES